MRKLEIGSIAIIFGGLLLSLEMYCLKVIQALDMMNGDWLTNTIDYAKDTSIILALIVTICVIAFGIILLRMSIKETSRK